MSSLPYECGCARPHRTAGGRTEVSRSLDRAWGGLCNEAEDRIAGRAVGRALRPIELPLLECVVDFGEDQALAAVLATTTPIDARHSFTRCGYTLH
ncbi:protein of unknown function [Methylocaldum szegediense]|uniref:Transposase n=1 Tax=Methylocaldum szegediense TaxID=73780 RepID=A0ABM9HY32_9GAMM|nr:protein of unknown function [Methylocaldum szegediense]